jgi:hypothetical protein
MTIPVEQFAVLVGGPAKATVPPTQPQLLPDGIWSAYISNIFPSGQATSPEDPYTTLCFEFTVTNAPVNIEPRVWHTLSFTCDGPAWAELLSALEHMTFPKTATTLYIPASGQYWVGQVCNIETRIHVTQAGGNALWSQVQVVHVTQAGL